MGWDSSRKVPWRRLFIEWAVATAVIVVVFALIVKETKPANYIAVGIGGLMYVGVGAVMAKFGFARKSFAELRREGYVREQERKAAKAGRGGATPSNSVANRPRPTPTSRTNASNRNARPRRR